MEAISTRYKGYNFRSRLEARFAVLFDNLGIEWKYEDEGYRLDDGTYYLPDFYIPSANAWIEIKGSEATSEEIKKSSFMSKQFKNESLDLIASGNPFVFKKAVDEGIVKKIINCGEKSKSENMREAYLAVRVALESVRNQKKSYIFECGLEGYSLLCLNPENESPTAIQDHLFNGLFYLLSTVSDDRCVFMIAMSSNTSEAEQIVKSAIKNIKKSINKAKSARFEHGEKP